MTCLLPASQSWLPTTHIRVHEGTTLNWKNQGRLSIVFDKLRHVFVCTLPPQLRRAIHVSQTECMHKLWWVNDSVPGCTGYMERCNTLHT